MKECVIYKYVYHGEIIYIGKSDNSLNNRIEGHKKEDKFQKYLDDAKIFFFRCKNPAETTIYETFLINKYKPILNTAMKYDHVMEFDIPELEWQEYESQFQNCSTEEIVIIKRESFSNPALCKENGIIVAHCTICGRYIGDENDTPFFSLIRRKYCCECAAEREKENSFFRQKKFKERRKKTNREFRALADEFRKENELLRDQIYELKKQLVELKGFEKE